MSRYLPAARCAFVLCCLVVTNSLFANRLPILNTNHPLDTLPGKYSGDLFVLEIPSDSLPLFKKDKWVFKFVKVRDDSMTLIGWRAKGVWGRKFKTEPQLRLVPTKDKAMTYRNDFFFGDIVLRRPEVKKIKACMKKCDVTAIRFSPDPDYLPDLRYIVTLVKGKSNCVCNKKSGVAGDTYYTNPSPPKGFKNSERDND